MIVFWLKRLTLWGLLPLFVWGCAVNPVTGRKELTLFSVSTEQEIAIGQKTFPQALQQMGGVYPDPQLGAYVNRVGQKLSRQSSRPELPYQFKVVNDSSPNAFALPGGFIAISRGLLVNLENEAQLAAVLGHEVGHVDARHSVQGLQRGTLLNVAMGVLSGVAGETAYGPLAQQTGQLAASLVENRYSRDQERDSDRLGIDYMVRAGYNPQGAVQLQEFFYQKIEGGAEPAWLEGLFRSHPFSQERMLANQQYINSAYLGRSDDPGLVYNADALRGAIARLVQTKRGYELYDEGVRHQRKGYTSQAVALFLQAATAAPDESLILTGLGMAYLDAQDLQSARRYLARAVRLDNSYFKSRLGLGYAHLLLNEPGQAVGELDTSMKLMPTLQGAFFLGEAYEKTGQRAKALEYYTAVARADPNGKLGAEANRRIKQLGGI